MTADQDDFYYPPERLAELLALAENPGPIPEDAEIDPPELVKALHASVVAYIADLPTSEQAEILNSWPQANRDAILAELPAEQRERLQTLTVL